MKKADNVLCPINCFVAGTLVLTEDGYKNVEDIQVGDKVLAKDDKTGDIQYKEVVSLFNRTANEIYTISVEGEEIIATPNHPFWVDGKGWLRADELSIDDFFVDEEGNLLDITAIEIDQTPLVVYNFEVEDYHTYFVGYSNLLTHNLNCIVEYNSYDKDPVEFAKQLKNQEDGLNQLTAGEIKKNIETYRNDKSAVEKVKKKAIEQYRKENSASSNDVHVLHDPDSVIGGYPDRVSGYGKGNVNSSIGSQNKWKQEQIYQAVKNIPADSYVEFIFKIK